jgi:ATP-dependent exoDNAse (exonuclease V) beta subunit
LADGAARDQIRHDTGSTLFVEAGAGSGKTTALVSRVQTLVLQDRIPIEEIAAVTFTERAAAELRDRLRARLEQAVRHEQSDGNRALIEAALDGLDLAAIGTLHAFAQRILAQHPIEAGVPPIVEVLDEVSSSVAFEGRWAQLRTELLDSDEMSATLELAFAVGITLDHVRSLIAKLNADWDLVRDHIGTKPAPPAPTMPDIAAVVAAARELVALSEQCTDPTDKFLPKLAALSEWSSLAELAAADPVTAVASLRATAALKWSYGKSGSWGGRLGDIKIDCERWQQSAHELVATVTEAALRAIVHWCGRRVLDSAEARRRDGQLEFHDLLVLTRNLLRENASVRATLRTRYRRLLLDEFQDTDPIQIEIAMRIAGAESASEVDWKDIKVPDGALFVVGDPKQSIYRFRRADIRMYLRAQKVLGGEVKLTTNFRTVEPILDWVNAVFAELIQHDHEKQPAYQALDVHRGEPTVGAPVSVLGAMEHEGRMSADNLREAEAEDVAAAIVTALSQGWTTADEVEGPEGTKVSRWRPLELGDITILVPARTSLPFLERALDDAGVMYRTESSSLVYHGQEVRDLFAACRALADPSDGFALVTALRSPLFGCGDDDLWAWKRQGGSFNLRAPIPSGMEEHIVGRAIAYLSRLQRNSRWLTPSEVLGRLAVDRRMFEVATFGPRARDSWRRLRFVIDQARAWSESEHGGLRAYLAWAAAQSAETARVAEAVLPESDVDSVRIMTIHAAKGLEFPMVVMSGMTSKPGSFGGVRIFWKDDGYAVGLTRDLQTGDFSEQVPLDEQMSDYERMRLLYVGATRARDHLVVSLHRCGNRATNARKLAEAEAAAAGVVELAADENALRMRGRTSPASTTAPPDYDAWLAGLHAAVRVSRDRPSISASGLEGTDPAVMDPARAETDANPEADVAAGLAKGGRDVEQPAWSKGRYGSAIGRAVHAVLQTVDLATSDGLDDAVAAQCVAEGVVEFADLVSALARSALDSEIVRRAAARTHWRESYVGMIQEDGTILEGIVDLIYREDDGSLVIVDYKTDDVPDPAIPARVAYYAPQLTAYADVVGAATGPPAVLTSSRLVFARPHSKARTANLSTSRSEP